MSNNVPERFADASVKAWRTHTGNDETADLIDAYVKQAGRYFDEGRGLLLIGDPGVGKTYLACAVLNALFPKYSVRFVTLYTYLRAGLKRMELKDQWMHAGDDDAYRTWKLTTREMEKIRSDYDFVVVDDVGMEHRSTSGNTWSEDEFQILLRVRYDHALPTIITTNHQIPMWRTKYGDAMASFVQEAYLGVPVTGADLRLRQDA